MPPIIDSQDRNLSEQAQRRPEQGLAAVALVNAATSVLMRISWLIVGIILTPFVLHRLGRDLYGVVVVTGSAYEYLSLLRGGIGGALKRYVTVFHHAGRHEEAVRYYAVGTWWGGIFRTFILLLGITLALPICRFLRLPPGMLADGAIGVALILAAAVISDTGSVLEIPTYATGRTAGLSILRTAMVFVRLTVIVVAFHLLIPSLKVYGASLILIETIPLFALVWMAQRTGVVGSAIPRPDLGNRAIRRELFQYGGLSLLSQAAGLLYVSTDNLLIGRFYGSAAVTHYSLGTRWSPLILGFLVTSISSLTPLFTQLEARGEAVRSRDALTRVVAITSALAVPFCLVPCVLGDLFLVHWVGPEYRSSYPYMIAMLAPATLEAALAPVWMALIAKGRIGWIATGDIIVAVGNVAISLLLALVFHMGLLGFALGNTIALLAKNLLLRPLAGRKDPSMPPAGEFLRPLPRALAGGAPALVLLYLLRGVYGGGLAQVIIAGFFGGALCLAGSALATIGPNGIRRIVGMLAEARHRRAD